MSSIQAVPIVWEDNSRLDEYSRQTQLDSRKTLKTSQIIQMILFSIISSNFNRRMVEKNEIMINIRSK